MPAFPIPVDERPRLVRVSDKEHGDDLTTTFQFCLPAHLARLHRVEPDVRLSVTTYGNAEEHAYGGRLSLSYRPQGRRGRFANNSSVFCSNATWPVHAATVLAYPGRSMLNMLAERRGTERRGKR